MDEQLSTGREGKIRTKNKDRKKKGTFRSISTGLCPDNKDIKMRTRGEERRPWRNGMGLSCSAFLPVLFLATLAHHASSGTRLWL